MLKTRSWILGVLVSLTTSIAVAEDYILPTGITVLTEEQLVNQLFGSTTYNMRWSEYCEPPSGNEREVKLRGMHKKYGPYVGRCIVKGHLFCRHGLFHQPGLIRESIGDAIPQSDIHHYP